MLPTPRKTNMEPENTLWKRRNIYKPPIFGFHVNFRGCTTFYGNEETTIDFKETGSDLSSHFPRKPSVSLIVPMRNGRGFVSGFVCHVDMGSMYGVYRIDLHWKPVLYNKKTAFTLKIGRSTKSFTYGKYYLYMYYKYQLNLGKCCEVRKVGVKKYPPNPKLGILDCAISHQQTGNGLNILFI